MRQYLALVRGAYMVGLAYRFGFLFAIAGNIVYMGVAYYLWRSIYASSESLNGLTFQETFLYVALGSAMFILLKTYTDWFMAYEIREGVITNQLVKPIDYQLYTLATSFGGMLPALTSISLPTLVLLLFVFRVPITLGVGLAFFPLSFALAFLISFCFDYAVGLMAFYTESGWGLSMTKEIILTVLSGALIPLQFFPEGIQKVLLWLPFQAIYHTPLMMVTKPQLGIETFSRMLFVQLAWVVILFALTRLFYNQAIKVLRISGG
jgi:ABC-2 type transport system permease protein